MADLPRCRSAILCDGCVTGIDFMPRQFEAQRDASVCVSEDSDVQSKSSFVLWAVSLFALFDRLHYDRAFVFLLQMHFGRDI
jgi:hypothetical protein